jgi:hypothetical protein
VVHRDYVWWGIPRARKGSRTVERESANAPTASLAPPYYVSDLDMLVEVFPHDHRLPAHCPS